MDWYTLICGGCGVLLSFLFFVGVVMMFELRKYILE